ncbi:MULTISPECIES: sialidase family protein [Thermomonosporaceae]|uniref:sialidase family protein n=1 Tax=Thermomonosporaceae TaxID=2012 RepID=UPI00255B3E80|nr:MULTISPECIES: sialidase family protein [Thermomonosporaceae]MDL4774117.1 sialidase family protein [Actinomadura xylanilytica]
MTAPASASAPAPPARVSGASPFASCTADTFPGDTYTVGVEAEPTLAIDPADPRRRVVGWQQDRWAYGSARGMVTTVTADGGRSWRQVSPPITLCSGGPYGRIANPWLTFGPDGRLYAAVMAAGLAPLTTGVAVLTSGDGGQSWNAPVEVDADPMAGYFHDKPALTVDPRHPRRAYLVWNRHNTTDQTHELLFSRTSDGGRTWEPARAIHRPPAGDGTIGNQIVVLPDGTLLDLFHEGPFAPGGASAATAAAGDGPELLRVMRSTDGGTTWSAPSTIAATDLGVPVLPGTTTPIVGASLVPDVTVDARGRVYMVWNDARLSGSRSAVALTASSDGGRTWARPRRVNGTPDSPPGGTGQAFTPQIDAAPDGTLAITYYDLRDDTAAAGASTTHWMATCGGPGCVRGEGFRERRLGGPFDLDKAFRWFDGPFLGSYTGLAHTPRGFVSAFVMSGERAGDPQDVYVGEVQTCSGRCHVR